VTADPLKIYQRVVGLRLNASQRQMIAARVHDPAAWRSAVDHWLAHRWNPRNIPGMLDSYARGGESACAACRSARHPTASGAAASGAAASGGHAPPSDPIQELKEKYGLTRPKRDLDCD
jgi:hypothetical protein